MSLRERAKDLKLLSLSREHQKNFNRDYKLQKKSYMNNQRKYLNL